MATTARSVPSTPRRRRRPRNERVRSQSASPTTTHRLYYSPRCEQPDENLIGSTKMLKSHDDRWREMSVQAGQHQQDESVLRLTRRFSPQSLRAGVTPLVASRVRELQLEIDDRLPEWMDAICETFFQLEHLYLSSAPCDGSNTSRMRRLYVLYRLPDLLSIDGKIVTEIERELARPSTPNGHRVPRAEWVTFQSFSDSDEESHASEDHGDAVEVALSGAVTRTPADVPIEEMDVSLHSQAMSPERRVFGTPDVEGCSCADDVATFLGLSLPTFENPLQLQHDSPVTQEKTPTKKRTKREKGPTSCDSTPERIMADAMCSTGSLSIASPFTIMFRGDGTLEEILERNKRASAAAKDQAAMISKPTPKSLVPKGKREAHSRTLSSPFPMQFRKKPEDEIDLKKPASSTALKIKDTATVETVETTVPMEEAEDPEDHSSVEISLEENARGPGLDSAGRDASASNNHVPALMPQGVPVPTLVRTKTPNYTTPARGCRPPKCPTSVRRKIPNQRRVGKRLACWRKPVRSKSIVDDDEDDEDTSTDEEDTDVAEPESP